MTRRHALQAVRHAGRYKTPAIYRYASTSPARQWSTPLAKSIAEAIQTAGPISIAAYMRQCLTNPDGGYYTNKAEKKDQFGVQGDFITSPEISQVFGELCGLWFVAEWMAQGRPNGVELIELGPGRGTLMDDMLRTIRNFKQFASSIESVYMIEASSSLRQKQKELLCGNAVMDETDIGHRSLSKYANVPVTWCEDIRFVPSDSSKTPFFIAHEFFDALPIHAFQSVAPATTKPTTLQGLDGKPIEFAPASPPSSSSKQHQWRELLISPTPPPSIIQTSSRPELSRKETLDFQLSLAKASTPNSLVLTEGSSRYKALKQKAGSIIEVSPESVSYAAEIARRIGGSAQNPTTKSHPSGAALIIDYGTADAVPTSTLRGIRAHELVSPFASPGKVDISADVDFIALVEAAINASEGVEAHGPTEQGSWLTEMGIHERGKILTKAADDKEKAEDIKKAIERLTERGGGAMGKMYKVLAIIPESGGKRPPLGFGGRLQE